MKQTEKRTKMIPLRVTPAMYDQLQDIAEGYDLPVALYCYLAVRKAVSFQNEVMHADDYFNHGLIP
jgi:hypothetical protein